MEVITRAVQDRDASVSDERVREMIETVARTTTMRTALAEHLRDHPAALTAGGSRMPKVAAEFMYLAIERGVAGVTSPGCGLCGRPKVLFHTYEEGQRICTTCYTRRHRATCSVCGREQMNIQRRTSAGEAICATCCLRAQPEGECAGCGRVMAVRRSGDGRRYCRRCQDRAAPLESCSVCGREGRVNARRADGGGLCSSCYTKELAVPSPCGECGQSAVLVARAGGRGDHDRDLCAQCYRHPKRECGVCGRTRRVAVQASETTPDVCPTCYWAPVVDCSECGQSGLGRRTTRDGQPWCFACQARQRIDQLLVDETGRARPGHELVRDALREIDPRSLLANWGRTESLTLLARLLAQHGHVTHELLDQEGSRTSVHYLRSMLVSARVLEERDEQLTRLRTFSNEVVADIKDVEARQVLSRYARWQVIARVRMGRDGLGANAAGRARQEIRTALRFLTRVTPQDGRIGDCTQQDVDRWISEGRSTTFPRWLASQGLLGAEVDVPMRRYQPSMTTKDPDVQLTFARTLLHDPASAGVEERAAGCLLLMYAQPLSKIVQLTIDDLIEDDGGMLRLKLGPEPLDLAPPLADLLRQLPIRKPFGAARYLADERWLFPGKSAGRHRHPTSLMHALNGLGISARTSRNTAVYHLARTVPPAVIASILGIDTTTAQRWAEQTGSNWLTYGPTREQRG